MSEAPPKPPSAAGRLRGLVKDVSLSLGIGLVALTAVGALRAPELPDQHPPLVARNLSGAEVDLSRFRGQRVLVNFWATWCGPCKVEMPMLQAVEDVPVLYASVDEDEGALRRYVRERGLPPERVLRLDRSQQAAWGVGTLPTTVVVGPEGEVEAAHSGLINPLQLWWWSR
jgi:thiol-disulfide isomerase/thioredoxin